MQNISTLLRTIICFSFFIIVHLTASAQDVSVSEIAAAEKMYGLQFTEAKRDSMMNQLKTNLLIYQYLHSYNLPNSVPLPQWFDPVLPEMKFSTSPATNYMEHSCKCCNAC